MTDWPVVRFGEFLKPNRRPYTLGPTEDGDLVGMRLYGSGPFHRERKDAVRIRKKSHFVVRKGDIIYNKLFAWKGTFGIVPEELDGMFVSDKFPTYELDEGRVERGYLRWYFRHPPLWEQARTLSTGTAALSKLTLNPPRFLDLTLPLPPLEEQRRIVAKIERLVAKVKEARSLRLESATLVDSLFNATAARMIHEGTGDPKALGELLREKSLNGLSPRPAESPPGVPILRISAATSRRDAWVDENDVRYLDVTTEVAQKYCLEKGDLLACRFNGNLDFVGRFSLFEHLLGEPRIYPDKLIRFRVDRQTVTPEYVRYALNSPYGRERIKQFCQTTAGNIGISAANLITIAIPVPSLEEQDHIVESLDRIQSDADRLSRLGRSSESQLDALLPSILDKAFKGEL